MIYPANFESKIGFDRIRALVAERCNTQAARAKLDEHRFSARREVVEQRIASADEMRTIIQMEHEFPNEEFCDLTALIAKVRVEGTFLDLEEAVLLARALRQVDSISRFIRSRERAIYPQLHRLTEEVVSLEAIANHIDSLIDRFGQMRDSASDELYRIRRSIREREGQASKRLQQVLQAAKSAGIVEADATLSIRDGRAVRSSIRSSVEIIGRTQPFSAAKRPFARNISIVAR